VTDDKSIINGTSSIAANPAVSTLSSLLSLLALPEDNFSKLELFLFNLEDKFL
jgi:hypothetical protein